MGPTGLTYAGNADLLTNGATSDVLNNLEQVLIRNPVAGIYRVLVVGTVVPKGPQTFALAATGQFDSSNDCTAPSVSSTSLLEGLDSVLSGG